MEAPLVEPGTERRFSLLTQAKDRQLAQLVGERLSGPADVAVDLGLDLVLGQRCMAREVIDRLLPRPALLVDSGVDDKARRPPHVVAQLAEFLIRRPIDA